MRARLIIPVLAFLLLGWLMWANLSTTLARDLASDTNHMELAGQWGDSFGAFNAFASILAFTILLATLLQQAKATAEQAADLHRQRFEGTFFELLRLLRVVRAELRFRYSEEYIFDQETKGTMVSKLDRKSGLAVRAGVKEFTFWLVKTGVHKKPTRDDVVNIYMRRVHSRHEPTWGPYFRVIYSILARLRDDAILSEEERIRYANLVRGQLTSYEISLVAINGLSPISNDMEQLLTRFRMLKYLPDNATRRRLKGIYSPVAFRPRDEDSSAHRTDFDVRLAVQRFSASRPSLVGVIRQRVAAWISPD